MNTGTANKVVIFSGLMTFGMGFANKAKDGEFPSARFLIGGSVTFIGLSFLVDFSPDLGAALAGAVATTALFSNGNGLLEYINGAGELDKPAEGSKKKRAQGPAKWYVAVAPDVGQIPGSVAVSPGRTEPLSSRRRSSTPPVAPSGPTSVGRVTIHP